MLKDEMVGVRGNQMWLLWFDYPGRHIGNEYLTTELEHIVGSAERAVWVAGGLEKDAASINSDMPVEENVAAFLGIHLSLDILNKVGMLLRIWEMVKQQKVRKESESFASG